MFTSKYTHTYRHAYIHKTVMPDIVLLKIPSARKKKKLQYDWKPGLEIICQLGIC